MKDNLSKPKPCHWAFYMVYIKIKSANNVDQNCTFGGVDSNSLDGILQCYSSTVLWISDIRIIIKECLIPANTLVCGKTDIAISNHPNSLKEESVL